MKRAADSQVILDGAPERKKANNGDSSGSAAEVDDVSGASGSAAAEAADAAQVAAAASAAAVAAEAAAAAEAVAAAAAAGGAPGAADKAEKEKKKLEAKEARKATSDAQAQISLFSQVVMNADMMEFTITTDPKWEWAKDHKKFKAMKVARAQLKSKAAPGSFLKDCLTMKMQDVKTRYEEADFTANIQKIPSVTTTSIAKLQEVLDRINQLHDLNHSDDEKD